MVAGDKRMQLGALCVMLAVGLASASYGHGYDAAAGVRDLGVHSIREPSYYPYGEHPHSFRAFRNGRLVSTRGGPTRFIRDPIVLTDPVRKDELIQDLTVDSVDTVEETEIVTDPAPETGVNASTTTDVVTEATHDEPAVDSITTVEDVPVANDITCLVTKDIDICSSLDINGTVAQVGSDLESLFALTDVVSVDALPLDEGNDNIFLESAECTCASVARISISLGARTEEEAVIILGNLEALLELSIEAGEVYTCVDLDRELGSSGSGCLVQPSDDFEDAPVDDGSVSEESEEAVMKDEVEFEADDFSVETEKTQFMTVDTAAVDSSEETEKTQFITEDTEVDDFSVETEKTEFMTVDTAAVASSEETEKTQFTTEDTEADDFSVETEKTQFMTVDTAAVASSEETEKTQFITEDTEVDDFSVETEKTQFMTVDAAAVDSSEETGKTQFMTEDTDTDDFSVETEKTQLTVDSAAVDSSEETEKTQFMTEDTESDDFSVETDKTEFLTEENEDASSSFTSENPPAPEIPPSSLSTVPSPAPVQFCRIQKKMNLCTGDLAWVRKDIMNAADDINFRLLLPTGYSIVDALTLEKVDPAVTKGCASDTCCECHSVVLGEVNLEGIPLHTSEMIAGALDSFSASLISGGETENVTCGSDTPATLSCH